LVAQRKKTAFSLNGSSWRNSAMISSVGHRRIVVFRALFAPRHLRAHAELPRRIGIADRIGAQQLARRGGAAGFAHHVHMRQAHRVRELLLFGADDLRALQELADILAGRARRRS
jgi:hypothetical protein